MQNHLSRQKRQISKANRHNTAQDTKIAKLFLTAFLLFFLEGCTIKYIKTKVDPDSKRALSLTRELTSLSKNVSKKEARDLAMFALSYTKILANRYRITLSPHFQNFLINMGLKKKGYCYNYADDLAKALIKRGYKSFDIYRVIYKKGSIFEHNAVLIRAKNKNCSGVILDGWRNAGILYFSKIDEDREYVWKIFYKVSRP